MKIFTDEKRQINNSKKKYEKEKFSKYPENEDLKSNLQNSEAVIRSENIIIKDDSFSRNSNNLSTNQQNTSSSIGNWARRNNAEAEVNLLI